MPVRYRFLSEARVLLFEYEGNSTNAQQFALFRVFQEDFGLTASVASVSDLSGLRSTDIDSREMFSLAARSQREAAASPSRVRQALYAPTDISYGIARMYQSFAELSQDIEVQIFECLQEAVEWVGLDEPAEELFRTDGWPTIDEDGTIRRSDAMAAQGLSGADSPSG